MQIMDLPLTVEMHYYLKGLKLEIQKLVESNELNLIDIMILKNVCLRQDHIISPPPESNGKTLKQNEENIALNVSTRDRYSYQGRGRGQGRYTR